MFLLLTYYGVCLFVGFYVDDSNENAVLIIHKSYIKSMFVSMLHQIWNLRYSRHIRIALNHFFLLLTLSSNVFNSLISVFRCKGITVLNQMKFHFRLSKKKKLKIKLAFFHLKNI